MKKTYVGICLDRSGSMQSISRGAVKMYNSIVKAIRDATAKEGQDTILFSNTFGGSVEWVRKNSSVAVLKEMTQLEYRPDGGTPLFRAVLEMIEEIKRVPDYADPEVAFQLQVITDGEENTSGRQIVDEAISVMRDLVKTDRWTFAFQVPSGSARSFASAYSVPEGNVIEWEATEAGAARAAARQAAAYTTYFTGRTSGMRSTKSFYTDLKNVKPQDVKGALTDVTKEVEVFRVEKKDKKGKESVEIRPFCEARTKKPFLKGAAFYELLKTESKVQPNKLILIRDRVSGKFYAGESARQLLGLPTNENVRLVPGDHSQYDVFVQSTSVNRHCPEGTRIAYWPKVGVPYTEGVSAPYDRS